MTTKSPLAWLVVLVGALGCSEGSSSTSARIDHLESATAAFDDELTRTEMRARALSAEWSELAEAYDAVAARYRNASRQLDEAKAHSQAAEVDLRTATVNFASAAASWRFFQAVIKQAAAMDIAALDRGSRATSCETVSTEAYRRILTAQGVDLAGKDIDHIVPHSIGGADHPDNYQILDSSLNRSLGAQWDREKCAMAGERCARAVAVSAKCGEFRGGF